VAAALPLPSGPVGAAMARECDTIAVCGTPLLPTRADPAPCVPFAGMAGEVALWIESE